MSRKVFAPNEFVTDTDHNLVYNLVIKSRIPAKEIIIGDTPTKIPVIPLLRRMSIMIRNWGSQIIYIGESNVTVAQGFPLDPRALLQLTIEEEADVYGIVASGNCAVRILEGA
jgi:hypothetical protein